MSIKTKAVRYAIRLAKKRTGLKVKKLKSDTLLQYITKAGQKRKLTETQRAAHKLRTAYEFKKKLPKTQIIINRVKAKKQHYESLKKKGPRITAKSELRYKSKQKPVSGGGAEAITTTGTRYGIGAVEHKVQRRGTQLIRRRWGRVWPHERESWKGEMERMFGGVHMAQTEKGAKKSIKILMKNYSKKKKKIKKATEGGEVVVHANVDRSLL